MQSTISTIEPPTVHQTIHLVPETLKSLENYMARNFTTKRGVVHLAIRYYCTWLAVKRGQREILPNDWQTEGSPPLLDFSLPKEPKKGEKKERSSNGLPTGDASIEIDSDFYLVVEQLSELLGVTERHLIIKSVTAFLIEFAGLEIPEVEKSNVRKRTVKVTKVCPLVNQK